MPKPNFIDDCMYLYYSYCYPIFFGKIGGPPIWPVIVVSIIIFIAVAEIGSQSCQGGKCNHYKSVESVKYSDPSSKTIDGIISRINLNHTVVGWRRALILAIILALSVLMYFYPGLPDGYDFFLVATILFIVIYLFSVWFQWHWWKGRDHKIENKLLGLRHKVKNIELDNNSYNSNTYHNNNNTYYNNGYSSNNHHSKNYNSYDHDDYYYDSVLSHIESI